jgi:hypothetical protein
MMLVRPVRFSLALPDRMRALTDALFPVVSHVYASIRLALSSPSMRAMEIRSVLLEPERNWFHAGWPVGQATALNADASHLATVGNEPPW